MKSWNEYFTNEDAQVNEEHHMETREEQVKWICEILKGLDDEEVLKVYEFLESGKAISKQNS